MVAKNGGKTILGISRQYTLQIHSVGQKFHRNRSMWHSFRDKCVFPFYAEIQEAEIQDGRQKCWENDFCKNMFVVM